MASISNFLYTFSIWALPVLFAITLHEVAHGWVAYKLGDPTAKMLGRLTINPIKHIDPVGTILIPAGLLLLGSRFLFGWAKPVPVTWQNLKKPRRDMILVAAAGPLSNFIMAFAWTALMKVGMTFINADNAVFMRYLFKTGQAGLIINLVLMVINLIPIPPLDGGRVLTGLLPPKMAYHYSRIEPFGFIIIVILLFTSVLGTMLSPILYLLATVVTAPFGIPIRF